MTDEQKRKPVPLLTWAVMGAVIGIIGASIVVVIVLAFGGLAEGMVTRGMWKAAAAGCGIPMFVTCAGIGGMTAGAAFGKQYREALELFVCLAACFTVQIGLVALVAYEIAPRFPEASQIQAEVE